MSYVKHNFQTGGLIKASDFNEVEDQIVLNETNIEAKQDALVSGENIKTVNGKSLLGSGNIEIEGGGGGVFDVTINGDSVVTDGVASFTANTSYGIGHNQVGFYVVSPSESDITGRKNGNRPIVVNRLDFAVKTAMCDGKGAAWTAAERTAALARLGLVVDSNGFVKLSQ